MVLLAHVRQRQVGHLVDQHPVVGQLGLGGVAPHGDADHATVVAVRRSAPHAVAFGGADVKHQLRDRKLAIVAADDTGGVLDPSEDGGDALGEMAVVEVDAERRAVCSQYLRRRLSS